MNPIFRNILIFLSVLLFCYLLWYFSNILVYILIAAVVAFLGHPIVRLIERVEIRKKHLKREWSASITLVILWAIFFGFFWFLIPLILMEAKELSNMDMHSIVDYVVHASERLSFMFPGLNLNIQDGESIKELAKEQLVSYMDMNQVSSFFGSIVGAVGNLFLAFFAVSFILFFFLKEEGMFNDGVLIFVPTKYEDQVRRALHSIATLLKRYFQGIILEIVGIMIIDTIGFTIIGLGFNHAVIVGLFAGLMNVIPYVGPWIGAAFGVVVAIATHVNAPFIEITLPIILLVLLVVAISQIIDNIFFQPIIYSKSVKAHPLEIFLVILMAGSFAGILGMVLAIPGYTVFRVIGREFLSEFKFVRKITESIQEAE